MSGKPTKKIFLVLLVSIIAGCQDKDQKSKKPIPTSKSVHAYVQDLSNDDAEIRRKAADALGQMGLAAREAVPALNKAYRDDDVSVRQAADDALDRIWAAETIQNLLKNENRDVRAGAAFDLGINRNRQRSGMQSHLLPSELAVPALTKALMDEDSFVRGRAAEALGNFKGEAESATTSLCERLKDRDTWVRNRAAYSLGYIGANRAVPYLIEALKDREANVRAAAADGLGLIGPAAKAAMPHLRKLLTDKDKDVQEAAKEAMLYIGEKVGLAAQPANQRELYPAMISGS